MDSLGQTRRIVTVEADESDSSGHGACGRPLPRGSRYPGFCLLRWAIHQLSKADLAQVEKGLR